MRFFRLLSLLSGRRRRGDHDHSTSLILPLTTLGRRPNGFLELSLSEEAIPFSVILLIKEDSLSRMRQSWQ